MNTQVSPRLEIPPSGTRGVTTPRLPGRFMQVMTDLMFRMYRKRRFMGFRVLRLTTIGAKSRQERRTILGYFDDPTNPEARVIVASGAGSAKHPAWYFNLATHPDQVWIEVGDQKLQVNAELLRGQDRDAAWQRVVEEAPNYATYPTKTDREIPLIRLTSA